MAPSLKRRSLEPVVVESALLSSKRVDRKASDVNRPQARASGGTWSHYESRMSSSSTSCSLRVIPMDISEARFRSSSLHWSTLVSSMGLVEAQGQGESNGSRETDSPPDMHFKKPHHALTNARFPYGVNWIAGTYD